MKSTADASSATGAADSDDAVMAAQLAAVARGDRQAFAALYLQLHPSLGRFLGRHTRRRELIDDIINETFWVVWRKAATFRGDARPSTWIIGIAYRCMLKLLREQATPLSTPTDSADADDGDDDAANQRERRDWLQRGMAQLPADQRTTLELAYYFGQTCEEIALVMDCAVGTVKARLFHARVRLRNTLPTLGGDNPVPRLSTGSPP